VSSDEQALFSAVDALLEQVAQEPLPEPAERRRLREAAGLSQEQIAKALRARREAVGNWEAGRTEPRPPKRAAYARLLEGLAARHPAPAETETDHGAQAAKVATDPAAPAAPQPEQVDPAPVTAPAPPVPAPAAKPSSTSRRPPAKKATTKTATADPAAVDPRFANGPLGVLDGDGSVYCVGGLVLDCPAKDIPSLVQWTLVFLTGGSGATRATGMRATLLCP
jgi:DNA-binding transcriptional regulator YiaG